MNIHLLYNWPLFLLLYIDYTVYIEGTFTLYTEYEYTLYLVYKPEYKYTLYLVYKPVGLPISPDLSYHTADAVFHQTLAIHSPADISIDASSVLFCCEEL